MNQKQREAMAVPAGRPAPPPPSWPPAAPVVLSPCYGRVTEVQRAPDGSPVRPGPGHRR